MGRGRAQAMPEQSHPWPPSHRWPQSWRAGEGRATDAGEALLTRSKCKSSHEWLLVCNAAMRSIRGQGHPSPLRQPLPIRRAAGGPTATHAPPHPAHHRVGLCPVLTLLLLRRRLLFHTLYGRHVRWWWSGWV